MKTKTKVQVNRDVVNEIYRQINGRKAMFLINGQAVIYNDNTLRVKFSCKNEKQINLFHIEYDHGKDLYNLKFYRTRLKVKQLEFEEKLIREINGCYSEDLTKVIETTLGLSISL